MKAIKYSEACTNLQQIIKSVCEDHAPVIISRKGGESVVLVSLADYSGLEETIYLLSNPANAKRLSESLTQLNWS